MKQWILVLVWSVVSASGVAMAAGSPGQKCQSVKNQAAGKYAACLATAEAKLLSTEGTCSATPAPCYDAGDCALGESCTKDLTKYTSTVAKCGAKFADKWERLTQKADDAEDPCPDGLEYSEIQDAVDEHIANVNAALAGAGLNDCSGDLAICEDDLMSCDAELATTEADLATAEEELSASEDDLAACNTDLVHCEGALDVALACGDGDIDAGEECDVDTLNGGTCKSEGFVGGLLRCGADCRFDTNECYVSRFEDNADGTITDKHTGLTWEKKVDLDSAANYQGNLHDADNIYRWAGTCSDSGDLCQPDADSEAACLASVEGEPSGCARCATGVCNVDSPGQTVWQWLVAVNRNQLDGYDDWRLATKAEYSSIVDDTDGNPPSVNVSFHGTACGSGCSDSTDPTCSCTKSGSYWTSTTYASSALYGSLIGFEYGSVNVSHKTLSGSARAVRGMVRTRAQANCGDGNVDPGEDCDFANFNGGSCLSEGFTGGELRCAAGCVYDTSGCYLVRFEDHGDGTITDNATHLMWEKKVKRDQAVETANLHDADNSYAASGICSSGGQRCQPDAASEAACASHLGAGAPECLQCPAADGSCAVGQSGTIWQMVAALNAERFGGYDDWRVPTPQELQSLRSFTEFTDSTEPMVDVAFDGAACGASCGDLGSAACSCTMNGTYWAVLGDVDARLSRWAVSFFSGGVTRTDLPFHKLRAVRGGS